MIVKRFHDEKLAQTSYLIGCAATGEALVVDANRDVRQYVAAAEAESLRVTHVAETHIHADFVSGSRELAALMGARLHLSAEGGEDWQYGFARSAGAVLLRDGDVFQVGNIGIAAVHTPGHTPEHLTFLVTDGAAADRPIGALTGDFLFVGDVGRPDLLERAAGVSGTMEDGARSLFRSLQRFRAAHPDWLQIWPGHGAGSACGKGIGSVPQSTLGYEALFNWAFSHQDEGEFVRAVLAGQPEPPRYFAAMKRLNREGPEPLNGFTRPPRLDHDRVAHLLAAGTVVVDTRPADDYAAAHIPGTVNIPLDRSFTTWSGWLVPYHQEFHLIGEESALDGAVRDLAMIGLDRVGGFFDPGVVASWAAADGQVGTVERVTPAELAERMEREAVQVVDIRGAAEWEAGRIPGVPNIPLGYLADRLDELPGDRPLVVHCQTGARSAIAASLLESLGVKDVLDLAGGFVAWRAVGLDHEAGAPTREFPAPAAVRRE
jgi:hydroxyacylglutathione hydrolase